MFNSRMLLKAKYKEEAQEGGDEGGSQQAEVYTAEQYKALQLEVKRLSDHAEVLLGETKQAKAKAKAEAEEKALMADEKARKDGDFEQLFKSSSDQVKLYKDQLDNLTSSIATEKRNSEAMKIATQLADGYNAELLSEKIAQRLKYTDEGVKILDSNGQLTVSTVEDLKNEFQSNERFASLLKGNQSSGGGAPGGKSGSAASKVIQRADFEGMTPLKQMEFIQSGGKLI